MTTDFQRKAKMNSDTKNMPNHWDCHLLGKREACVSFSSEEPLLQTVG